MSPLVIEASKLIQKTDPSAKFFMPLVDETHRRFIPKDLDIDHINFSYGDSQEVLSLSDLGIVTSGTASLEALLVRTPVVVAYRTNWLNYAIIKPLLNISRTLNITRIINTGCLNVRLEAEKALGSAVSASHSVAL